jgi:hypothetical protein
MISDEKKRGKRIELQFPELARKASQGRRIHDRVDRTTRPGFFPCQGQLVIDPNILSIDVILTSFVLQS